MSKSLEERDAEMKELNKKLEEALKRPKTVAEMAPQILIYLGTLILVILKALGYITISWWWVTLFLWLPFAFLGAFIGIMLVILAFALVVFGFISLFEAMSK